MGEEIDFENRKISNFKGLVTLTLDRVIRHTVVHHSSTSTYIPNFIGIRKTFCGRTDGRTSELHIEIIRSTLRSRPKNEQLLKTICDYTIFLSSCSGSQPKSLQFLFFCAFPFGLGCCLTFLITTTRLFVIRQCVLQRQCGLMQVGKWQCIWHLPCKVPVFSHTTLCNFSGHPLRSP